LWRWGRRWPALRLGRLARKRPATKATIFEAAADIAARVVDVTRGAIRLQSGYIYHYALAMLIGVVALATWFSFGGQP